MKFKYQFVNEAIEVDIDKEWGEVLLDFDRQEYNNLQKETKHHISMDGMVYEGEVFAQEEIGYAALFAEESQAGKLRQGMAMLKPEHQKIIKAIFFEGIAVSEYAKKEGVSQPAISQRLKIVIKKLKKLL